MINILGVLPDDNPNGSRIYYTDQQLYMIVI